MPSQSRLTQILLPALISFASGAAITAWLMYTHSGDSPGTSGSVAPAPASVSGMSGTTEEMATALGRELGDRLDVILAELYELRDRVDRLDTTLADSAFSAQMPENRADTSARDVADRTNATSPALSGPEIETATGNILSRLSEPGFDMGQLASMPELQALPPDARSKVLGEIARRLDSGEIDKRTFLPGYVDEDPTR